MDIQEYLDQTELRLLQFGGVDNWSYYGEALQDAGITDDSTDSEILNALETGGVDNWSWYGEARGEFPFYEDYVREADEDGQKFLSYDEWLPGFQADKDVETNDPEPEDPEEKEDTPAQVLLRVWMVENFPGTSAEALFETVFKRETFPTLFDRAIKEQQSSDEDFSLLNLQERYVRILLDNESELKTYVKSL